MNLAQMKDDRGNLVPICEPRDIDMLAKKSLRGLHRKAWKTQPRVLLYSALLMVCTYVASTFFFRSLFKRPITTPEVIGAVSGFAITATAIALSAAKRRAANVTAYKEDCLQRTRCPSCAYNLAGISAQPDLCTLCPECGAAWRLPERKDAHSPEVH